MPVVNISIVGMENGKEYSSPTFIEGIGEASKAIAREAAAGRLQDPGSFNWVPPDINYDGIGNIEDPYDLELNGYPLELGAAIVPTHGKFAGPGFCCGDRKPHTRQEILDTPVADVYDSVTGIWRNDYVDLIAKPHDLAYTDAEAFKNMDFSKYLQMIKEADQKLIDSAMEMLEKDSRGEIHLTEGERNYGRAMLELFKMKQALYNKPTIVINNAADLDRLMYDIYKSILKATFNNLHPKTAAQIDNADLSAFKQAMANAFSSAKSYAPPPTDPFALDLDGDGIETTNVTSGILFDHNADGVKTGTGWIKGDDGLLVRDLNANGAIDAGRELFGDQTVLTSGQLAANGFAALADIDTNSDGIIDSSDAAFGELKVWRDLNQDGISQENELQNLADAGIASINLTSTSKNQWQNGNTIASTGTYTKTDGNTGATSDINLASNIANSEFTDTIEIPEELQNLPDMSGSGKVRDLLQAATLSPELAGLLTQYAAATTREAQMALIDQMLLAWADTSGMAKSLDERDPAHYKVEYLNIGSITRSSHLQQNITPGPVTGGWYYNGIDRNIYNVTDTFIFADGTVWDREEALRQSVIKPTESGDIIIGSRVDDTISGLGGNDTIIGNKGDDIIDGGTGDDTLVGSGYTFNHYYTGQTVVSETNEPNGNDTYLFGRGDGHDTIIDADNSINNDTLYFKEGVSPSDITIARSGDDLKLTITDTGDSVTISRYFYEGYSSVESHDYEIENIRFSDGTVWTAADIGNHLMAGTENDDTIIGYSGNDTINGGAGNDTIDARTGDDIINGGDGNDIIRAGLGNDTIDGGAGNDTINGIDSRFGNYSANLQTDNDTYLFGFGDGHDTITEGWGRAIENNDTIRFKEGVAPEDVIFQSDANSTDLKIILGDGSDTITVKNWFWDGRYKIESFEFSDGTVLGSSWVDANLTIPGTDGDDTLTGTSQSEILKGFAGNDLVFGNSGNDTLEGGFGNDTLWNFTYADGYDFETRRRA